MKFNGVEIKAASTMTPKETAKQKLKERIENDFKYHRADPNKAEIFEGIRARAKGLAMYLVEVSPQNSRELHTALTKLDEVVFWANASVARYETEVPESNRTTEIVDDALKAANAAIKSYEEPKPLTREEIVKRAKRDLIEFKNYKGNYRIGFRDCIAEFHIDREKRTVVALMKGFQTGKVRARGIAKADPKDVFNEHIGKAIALRRALDIEVPEEYLNTPQPRGSARVGDKVEHRGHIYTIVDLGEWKSNSRLAQDKSIIAKFGKVIDDSNRKY